MKLYKQKVKGFINLAVTVLLIVKIDIVNVKDIMLNVLLFVNVKNVLIIKKYLLIKIKKYQIRVAVEKNIKLQLSIKIKINSMLILNYFKIKKLSK